MIMTDGPDGYTISGYDFNGDRLEGDIDQLTLLKRRVREQRSELYKLNGKAYHESKLRDQHPGLKDIWEQYQVLLKLVDK